MADFRRYTSWRNGLGVIHMGAWGAGSFENDAVLDWTYTFAEEPSLAALREKLEEVVNLDPEEYLDSDPCYEAVGAAETVAALKGKPNPELPDRIRAWADAQPKGTGGELIDLAVAAVVRVESESELVDLFDENGRDEAWHGKKHGTEI